MSGVPAHLRVEKRVRVLLQQRGVRTWGRGTARGLMSVGKLQEDRVGFSLTELKDKSCPHTSGGVCIGCLTQDPLLPSIPNQISSATHPLLPIYTLNAKQYPFRESKRHQILIPHLTCFLGIYCFQSNMPSILIMASPTERFFHGRRSFRTFLLEDTHYSFFQSLLNLCQYHVHFFQNSSHSGLNRHTPQHISYPLVQNALQPPKHFILHPKVTHAAVTLANVLSQSTMTQSVPH